MRRGLSTWPPTAASLRLDLSNPVLTGVELFQNLPPPNDWLGRVCALANSEGGDLLLGVRPKAFQRGARRGEPPEPPRPVGISTPTSRQFGKAVARTLQAHIPTSDRLSVDCVLVPGYERGSVIALRVRPSQYKSHILGMAHVSAAPSDDGYMEKVRRARMVEMQWKHRRARDEMRRRRQLGSDARGSQAIRADLLSWQVLPPGRLGSWLARNGWTTASPHPDVARRIEVLDELEPIQWYAGSHLGAAVYLVAEFRIVTVADSLDYGNALYYCFPQDGDWRRIFRLDKQEARKEGAKRIIHTGDWEQQVRRLVGGSP